MAFREGFNPSAFPDWAYFLEQWKTTLARLDEISADNEARLHAAEELAENLKTFVNNYFDDLDVQIEVNRKIDNLVADGTFLQIAEPTIAANVADWLIDNITQPEGVVIDTSLTVAGACADAKAAGDAITELQTGLSVKTVSPNKFNGVWHDGYINMSGNTGGAGTYSHTDQIPTGGATYMTVTRRNPVNPNVRNNSLVRFVTAYDAGHNLQAAYGLQNVGTSGSMTGEGITQIALNPAVSYVVLSVYEGDASIDFMVRFGNTGTDYQPFGTSYKIKEGVLPPQTMEDVLHRYLNGKTIAVYGDSIMQGTGNGDISPVEMLAEKYGMTCYKYSKNGATMGIRADYSDRAYHIGYQIADSIGTGSTPLISPDFVIFDGGTNDHTTTALGDMSKVYTMPSTESNFSDGFNAAACRIKNTWMGAKVAYIRVHNMASRTYDNQISFGERGVAIAEKWGFDVIDLYKHFNTQLTRYQTAYLSDYTHPNAAGYAAFYVPALEKWLYDNRPAES